MPESLRVFSTECQFALIAKPATEIYNNRLNDWLQDDDWAGVGVDAYFDDFAMADEEQMHRIKMSIEHNPDSIVDPYSGSIP